MPVNRNGSEFTPAHVEETKDVRYKTIDRILVDRKGNIPGLSPVVAAPALWPWFSTQRRVLEALSPSFCPSTMLLVYAYNETTESEEEPDEWGRALSPSTSNHNSFSWEGKERMLIPVGDRGDEGDECSVVTQ